MAPSRAPSRNNGIRLDTVHALGSCWQLQEQEQHGHDTEETNYFDSRIL